MKRTPWILGSLFVAVGTVIGIGGCGGHDHCYDCEQPSFAGIYEGSGINSAGLFSANLTISPSGAISGTESQITGGTGTWTVSGATDNSGNASLTLSPTTGSAIVETGVLGFAAPGVIQVALYPAGSNTPIPLSLADSAGLYSGNYTGSYALTSGTTGTDTVSIDVNGNITGTLTSTSGTASTITGTVSSLGVASVTVTPSVGAATTYTGGAAYNISNQLVVTAANGKTTLSLNLLFVSDARRSAFSLKK